MASSLYTQSSRDALEAKMQRVVAAGAATTGEGGELLQRGARRELVEIMLKVAQGRMDEKMYSAAFEEFQSLLARGLEKELSIGEERARLYQSMATCAMLMQPARSETDILEFIHHARVQWPAWYEPHLALGIWHLTKQKEYARAYAEFKLAAKMAPSASQGVCQSYLAQCERSMTEQESTLGLAAFQAGMQHIGRKVWKEAIMCLQASIAEVEAQHTTINAALSQRLSILHFNLAHVFAQRKEHTQALRSCQQSLRYHRMLDESLQSPEQTQQIMSSLASYHHAIGNEAVALDIQRRVALLASSSLRQTTHKKRQLHSPPHTRQEARQQIQHILSDLQNLSSENDAPDVAFADQERFVLGQCWRLLGRSSRAAECFWECHRWRQAHEHLVMASFPLEHMSHPLGELLQCYMDTASPSTEQAALAAATELHTLMEERKFDIPHYSLLCWLTWSASNASFASTVRSTSTKSSMVQAVEAWGRQEFEDALAAFASELARRYPCMDDVTDAASAGALYCQLRIYPGELVDRTRVPLSPDMRALLDQGEGGETELIRCIATRFAATYRPVQPAPTLLTCERPGCDATHKSRCGACRLISYCSPSCQRDDWKRHKLLCAHTSTTATAKTTTTK